MAACYVLCVRINRTLVFHLERMLFVVFLQMGPGLYTLATALFDVNNCVVQVFTGNPLTAPVQQPSWPVSKCVLQNN